MKLTKLVEPIVDLSDKPSVSLVTKLKKNDLILHEGTEFYVEFPPKKIQKGIWWIGLRNEQEKKYVKIIEDTKPRMTAKEKQTMSTNIRKIVKQYSKNDPKMIGIIKSYYENLAVHNNYDSKDVRDIMNKFPIELLKASKVPL